MSTAESILEQAATLLSAPVDVPALDDAQLIRIMTLTEQLGRHIDSLRVATAAEVAERSRHELGSDGLSWRLGQRRPSHLIEQLTRISGAEAARRMRLGALTAPRKALDGHPLPPLFARVAEALETGAIGFESASHITKRLEQATPRCTPDDLLHAEAVLVERAHSDSADLIGEQAILWRDALDADGAEPREEELRQRAHFHLGRERNGMTPFGGEADPVNAARLRAMLSAYTAPGASPRFIDAHTGVVEDAPEVAALPADTRTSGQRNFDILMGVLGAGLTADDTVPLSKTMIVASIRVDDLDSGRGVGWLDGVTESISGAKIRELGCDADVRLLAFGAHGEVLALGRHSRLFTRAQRIALAARDGGCIWPQCTAPPSWCDAHHVIPWSSGGATDVDNGVLLCSAHHHMLHSSDFELRMEHGVPRLLPPRHLGISPPGSRGRGATRAAADRRRDADDPNQHERDQRERNQRRPEWPVNRSRASEVLRR